jgi:predicted amino acid-binding ACT domain protein
MILLVDLSRCPNFDLLHAQMDQFGREAGLNLVLQHYDIFKATNEISRL